MFGLTSKKEPDAIAPRSSESAAPEMWIPRRLNDTVAARATEVAAHLSPLTDRDWSEYLNESVADRGGARSFSNGSRIEQHLTRFVADTQNAGKVPPRHVPVDVSAVLGGTPTDLRQEESRTREAREHAAEFRAQVAALSAAILGDAGRSWDAYVTLRLIADAEASQQAEKDAARREQTRLALMQCPVCGSEDPANGAVNSRAWPGVSDWRRPKVRSCEACYEAHRLQHFTERAAELLDGRTRADRVRAAASGGDPR
ncbi:hypothetical protein GCM10007198_14080 [Microbacterium aerolatum]|uniref:Uncharacterized protein n=2 Tax=Microbacterium aerolatum TaxID=153731 RepID=A0A511AJ64_9MICO|nr:hypothetical protein MAE01_19870 [Microbacterium aerolatum]GGB24899.1 hypothetical protein GCM10007198_14080 [Microbacterium aerolatum]